MPIERILLPTDFGEQGAAATACACELAERLDAELHLLHVLATHSVATPDFGMGLVLPARAHESRAAAELKLHGVLKPEFEAGRSVVKAILDGTPADAILDYAKQHKIDLIVMGTHGRSGMAHALFGSVTEQTVRQATCPVMTVRPDPS